jgi:hypothetical protein
MLAGGLRLWAGGWGCVQGRVAYAGARIDCLRSFRTRGFRCPPQVAIPPRASAPHSYRARPRRTLLGCDPVVGREP